MCVSSVCSCYIAFLIEKHETILQTIKSIAKWQVILFLFFLMISLVTVRYSYKTLSMLFHYSSKSIFNCKSGKQIFNCKSGKQNVIPNICFATACTISILYFVNYRYTCSNQALWYHLCSIRTISFRVPYTSLRNST